MLVSENTYQSIRVNFLSHDNEDFKKEVSRAYKNFLNGKWGKVTRDQAAYNDETLSIGVIDSPIIGIYPTRLGNLCILTYPSGKTKLVMSEEI